LYASLGRTREEIEQLEALAAVEPADADRLVSVALAYARHGRTDAAILALRRASDKFPDATGIYSALGRVWLQVADAQEDASAARKALEALQPIATRATATSDTLTLFGRALLMSGNALAAERVFQQATSRLPVNPDAFVYLADAASRLGHTEIARASRAEHAALAAPWTQSDGRLPAN
jgi:predicted Zn-dependent protease